MFFLYQRVPCLTIKTPDDLGVASTFGGSQWPLSLQFFEQLRGTQSVDEIALGAAISACEEGGHLDVNGEKKW